MDLKRTLLMNMGYQPVRYTVGDRWPIKAWCKVDGNHKHLLMENSVANMNLVMLICSVRAQHKLGKGGSK